MFERISQSINLFLLRAGEWIDGLSPFAKKMLFVAIVALLAIGARLGLIPSRGGHTQCFYCR
jgi:hypothetical protein